MFDWLYRYANRLRFPPAIEAQFREDYQTNTISTTRLALVLGLFLYSVFGILDIYAVPISKETVWFIRFGIVAPVIVFALAASYVDVFEPYIQAIICFVVAISGLGIVVMISISREAEFGNRLYFTGLILISISNANTSARLRSRAKARREPGACLQEKTKGVFRMPESPLAKKMKLKAGLKAAVINAPENYVDELRHDTAMSATLNGKFDWIQIFVRSKAELDGLAPRAAKALKPESMLWISFPKGSSKIQTDLTRDKGWESLQALDLKWITLVSVNETWSAFALRPYKEGEKKQSFR